jgi:multidrug resistance efflux pump
MRRDQQESRLEPGGGLSAEPTPEQYEAALARAHAFVRSASEMRERAQGSLEVASARLHAAQRTLGLAHQVLARIELLGRRFEAN